MTEVSAAALFPEKLRLNHYNYSDTRAAFSDPLKKIRRSARTMHESIIQSNSQVGTIQTGSNLAHPRLMFNILENDVAAITTKIFTG